MREQQDDERERERDSEYYAALGRMVSLAADLEFHALILALALGIERPGVGSTSNLLKDCRRRIRADGLPREVAGNETVVLGLIEQATTLLDKRGEHVHSAYMLLPSKGEMVPGRVVLRHMVLRREDRRRAAAVELDLDKLRTLTRDLLSWVKRAAPIVSELRPWGPLPGDRRA